MVPIQQSHPWRATLRTAFQVGIPALLTLCLVLPLVVDIVLDELGETLPAGVRAWLLAAAALITAIASAAARIMAIPAVDAWLDRLKLSSAPITADGAAVITGLPLVGVGGAAAVVNLDPDEHANLVSLRDVLDEGDPARAALDRILTR